ncbi:MAG TPA: Ig-like domain-containing protein [Candidatus Limnocylindrales bacterium]|nr:Ig-like domain-containing protein [Candidatus Limnocylindrales bacterium]
MKTVPSILSSVLAISLPFTVSGQTYSITEVGSPTWSYSEAHGLNGSGKVVGEYEPTNLFNVLAFLFNNGTTTNLGNLTGSPYAVAYAINDAGQIVGESNSRFDAHAFLYENGQMTDLGTLTPLAGSGYSSAHAINLSGQVAGETSLTLASTIHAALFSGGTIKDLGALGGDYSAAYGINKSGVIVGESDVLIAQGVTNVHAFVYTNGPSGSMVDLGTLGGSYSSAKGVNDSATVVGESETVIDGTTVLHAFMYRDGVMSDIGTLGGSTSSASAINNAGLIVGYATDANEIANAFLYDGSKMINLTALLPANSGWTNLASADGINDAGQIIGSGYLADGEFQGYLLTLNSGLTVSVTNPAANASFEAPATVIIGASVTDSTGTITNVQFRVNGSVLANVTSSPYQATASNLAAGNYTLLAIAADNAGLTASNSIAIVVTNATTDLPPTVSITNPAANSTLQAPATILLGASATDPDGSVTNVEFRLNGGTIGNVTAAPYGMTVSNIIAGNYALMAIASDNSGFAATNSINFVVTDVAPTVAITNPAPGSIFQASASFVIGATAADTDGNVTNVQFLVNGGLVGNAGTAPYSVTVNNLSAGNYTLTAIASDNAGLSATNSIGIAVTNGTIAPVLISKPGFQGNGFSFSFVTQSGHSYSGQFATHLLRTNNWVTFTNVVGNGTEVRVTDSLPTNAQRYYRVVAQ